MIGVRLSIAGSLWLGTLVLPQSLWAAKDPVPAAPPATESAISLLISLEEYAARLHSLDQLVAKCQSATSAANCQRDSVGPDARVALPAGARDVRFGWLRELMDQAAKGETVKAGKAATESSKTPAKATSDKADSKKPAKDDEDEDSDDADADEKPSQSGNREGSVSSDKGPQFPPATLAQRLAYARERLAADEKLAEQMAQQPDREKTGQGAGQPSSSKLAEESLAAERRTLDQILAAKEYQTTVVGPSIRDRVLEKVARWINQVVNKVSQAGFKSKWVGTAAEIAFVVALCIALVWFLIRLERQGRLGPALIRPGPGMGAASARDWQFWLQDAHRAAAAGEWRDAIHLLYWASISRLESSGLWPADRARTPREYLALLSYESQHRPDLSALTGSFERTWYAGRHAAEGDFRRVEQIAGRLGVR